MRPHCRARRRLPPSPRRRAGASMLLVLIAACGGESQEGAAAPTTGEQVVVVALDNSFRPLAIEVGVGDTVVWENRGINEHNVLSIEADDWGVEVDDFQPGARYSHVFDAPGEYRYYCSIHGDTEVGMVGTVLVGDR